jgi:hypothetical protein
MVMEKLESTRWTDNSPHPFGPAPGGGVGSLASTKWTSTVPTPFGPAPGGGSFGGVYDSGFAAEPVEPVEDVDFADDHIVNADWKIHVTKKQIAAGMVPSMVLQFFITDRGLSDKATFDKNFHHFLQAAGFKVSLKTSFNTEPVTWRWKTVEEVPGFASSYPVVAAPSKWAGLTYAGNAIATNTINPTDEILKRVPNHVYIYTMAVTSANKQMSDGDAAQVITLVKQGLINMNRVDEGSDTALQIAATVTGCPHSIFDPKPLPPIVKGVISSLILVAAWEMLATQFGSERL